MNKNIMPQHPLVVFATTYKIPACAGNIVKLWLKFIRKKQDHKGGFGPVKNYNNMFNDKITLSLIILNIILAVLVGILLQTCPLSTGNLGESAPVVKHEPELESDVAPEDNIRAIRITLDPGHTIGTGNGNRSYFGESESEIVWVMTLMLESKLTELGYEVIKTRSDPYQEMTLPERSKIANNFGADLLLSLHSDLGNQSGYAFFVPDKPGQSEDKTGPSPEISMRSRELAEQLDRAIQQVGPIKSRGVKSEEFTYAGNLQGALTISIYAEVPVITLELGFLDHEIDGPFLASAAGKILWVETLAQAINQVFQ